MEAREWLAVAMFAAFILAIFTGFPDLRESTIARGSR